jgi:sec-independent protein translocase protein TatA
VTGVPSGQEWLIVLLIVLVVFGGSQLPKLARSLGQAQNEFKQGMKDTTSPDDEPGPPSA